MMTLIQFQGGRCAYVEVPAEYSVEVDTPFDLAFAEQVAILSNKEVSCNVETIT